MKASRRIAITCATETLTGLEAAAEVWLHPPALHQPPERSLCPPWTRLGSAPAAQRTIVSGISVSLSAILRSSSQHDLLPVPLTLKAYRFFGQAWSHLDAPLPQHRGWVLNYICLSFAWQLTFSSRASMQITNTGDRLRGAVAPKLVDLNF